MRGCACGGTSGCAHVSCLVNEGEFCVARAENNLDLKVQSERFGRWDTCRLCEQQYRHGSARAQLGVLERLRAGRPGRATIESWRWRRQGSLSDAKHYEEALPVREAVLSMQRRLGDGEENILSSRQSNLSLTYHELGRFEEALTIKRYVYSERSKLNGEEHAETLREASLLNPSLCRLKRFRRSQVGTAQDDARGAASSVSVVKTRS